MPCSLHGGLPNIPFFVWDLMRAWVTPSSSEECSGYLHDASSADASRGGGEGEVSTEERGTGTKIRANTPLFADPNALLIPALRRQRSLCGQGGGELRHRRTPRQLMLALVLTGLREQRVAGAGLRLFVGPLLQDGLSWLFRSRTSGRFSGHRDHHLSASVPRTIRAYIF